MADLARKPNALIKDTAKSDTSSDDVQVIDHITSKNQKSAIQSAQKEKKVATDHVNEPEIEILSGPISKSPIPNRNNDSQRRMSNSASKLSDSGSRIADTARSMPIQHFDDKGLELAINAKNQLSAIYNNIDLKPKNTVGGYNDLGNTAIGNQLLLIMLQNQGSLPVQNAFAVNNVNFHDYGQRLPANKMALFPQEYSAYQSMLFPDAGSVFNQNAQAFYANNLLDKVPRTHPAGLAPMEDQRGKLHSLMSSAINDITQNRPVLNQKLPNTTMNSETHTLNQLAMNNEMSLQKSSGLEDHLDHHSPSDSKMLPGEDQNTKRKRIRTCFNPFCQTDPNNQTLWSKGRVQGKMTCKICEEAWKKQQYCYFCKQVYIEDGEGYSDSKPWIDCDICKRWTHTECEDKNIQKEILLQQEKEGNVAYNCPSCRNKTKGVGRGKYKRGVRSPNEAAHNHRNGAERPSHEEIEQDSVRKQIKLNPEPVDQRYFEINGNSNSNPIFAEEACLAQKKLENMFNKHINKRKYQIVRQITVVDSYLIVDNLLAQYSKKLQLSESEVKHDLQIMRDAGKSLSTDKNLPIEEEYPEIIGFENDDGNIDDDKKGGPRTLRGRGNPKRPGRAEHSMRETFTDDDTASEYITNNTSTKRPGRGRKRVEN